MGRRGRGGAGLVPAGPAAALPPQYFPGVPKRAVTVAGPTASGATLAAYDAGRSLCLALLERSAQATSCSDSPPRLRQPGVSSSDGGSGRRSVHYGTVVPEVAAVELVFRRGRRVRVETAAGEAYRGRYAGRVRFFLAEVRGRVAEPYYVRELAADGSLLAVVDNTFIGFPVGRTTTVASGRLRSRRWKAEAFRRRVLAPVPRELERFRVDTCVALTGRSDGVPRFVPRRFAVTRRAEACLDTDRSGFQELAVGIDSSCRGLGAVLTGLAPPSVDRLVAVLGDGTRRRVRLHALPERFGEHKAFALVLPPSIAVRRVLGLTAGGNRVDKVELGLPPGSSECGRESLTYLSFFEDLTEPLLPPPGPEGPMLLVRDEGVLLCVAIDAFAPDGSDCRRPPLDGYETRVLSRGSASGTLAAGVTPVEVTTVELELDGGEQVRVPTAPLGAPHMSRYDEQVNFFTAKLMGERSVLAARLFDADGRRLQTLPGPDEPPFAEEPVTLLRGRGGLRLSAGAVSYPPFQRRKLPCLILTRKEEPEQEYCIPVNFAVLQVEARCSPRGLVLWGSMRPGTRLMLRTTRGLTRARTVALPRRLGARKLAFLLLVHPRAAPRELIAVRKHARRRVLRLPPAASQCGYTALSELP